MKVFPRSHIVSFRLNRYFPAIKWGEWLIITSFVGISSGIGFGAAIRLNQPEEPGATILHLEQSFPPRQEWPIGR